MSNKNSLAYSTDSKTNTKCQKCGQKLLECQCAQDVEVDTSKIQAVLSIEKSGRSGKTVTVISRLPASESFLRDLLATLKQKCGAGGTQGTDAKRAGFIEIQGDQREKLRLLLAKSGIRVKN